MKKSSIARIMILVLSLALLIGSVMAITAMASEEADGTFGAISTGYGDKVYLRVEVKATEDQINNGNVVVSYKFADEAETKNATYFSSSNTDGYVWVITEGIAAYDMAREVVFSSNVGENTIEENRTYSVAQFLYKMLYTESTATEAHKDMYKALIEYGRTSQIALQQNTDKMINASTLVTGAEGITFGGKDFAFAPGAKIEVTPEWANANDTVIGWTIKEGETTKEVGLTFECSGIVEVVAPILGEHVDTINYTWAADNSYCKATLECSDGTHTVDETVYIDEVKLNVNATKVTYTYNVAFTNTALFAAQTKTVEADVTLENSIATINAPAITNKKASHDYMKFDFHNTEATYEETIYYSAVSVWDGTSVSESLEGSGTAEDPFLIQSAADFVYFANFITAHDVSTDYAYEVIYTDKSGNNFYRYNVYKGQYFKMTKSIDLNNNSLMVGYHSDWNVYSAFEGILDGNNCSIRNINVSPLNGTSAALFGCLQAGGEIKNLSVYGNVSGAGTVGGVVAYQLGTVTNVTSYVTVTATSGTVGGVVANQESSATGPLSDCVNYGTVTSEIYIVGGIVGSGGATITGCTNWGTVSGTTLIAGISGENKAAGKISGCYNYGTINGSEAGGIVGNLLKPVENCVNYGDVIGGYNNGGIAGQIKEKNSGSITNCVNYGNVLGTSTHHGGILGSSAVGSTSAISGCTNYGKVTASWGGGGIAGYAVGTITNCVNNGEVAGSGQLGGIVGKFNGTSITGCTNKGTVNASNSIIGAIVGGLYAHDAETTINENNSNEGEIILKGAVVKTPAFIGAKQQ